MIADPEHNGDDWEPDSRCSRCSWREWETLVWAYTGLLVFILLAGILSHG